jgi:hypothetical protein
MESPKARPVSPNDRLGVPRVDILTHIGLSASRGAGSPRQPLNPARPMPEPCVGMNEGTMRQLFSEAALSGPAALEELPRFILRNETDRHLGEMQLRASNTTPTKGEAPSTLWRDYVTPWTRWLEESKFRAKGTRDSYEWHVTTVLSKVGKLDLREITYRDVQDALGALKARNGSWKPNTRNVYVASMRSFYTYVIDKEDLDELGVKDIGRKLDSVPLEQVEREKIQHDPPTKDEVQSIVDRAETSGDIDFALALRYYWVADCRIADVWAVRWSQLDLGPDSKAFYEKPSKHGNKLWRLLDQRTAKRLRARKQLVAPADMDEPVFARPGEKLRAYNSRFDRHLKRRAAEAGVERYVHTHLIRAAVESYAEPAGIPEAFMVRQGGRSARGSRDTYLRYDPEVWRKWVEKLALD